MQYFLRLPTPELFAKLHAHFSTNESLRHAMLEYKPFSFHELHQEFTVNAKIPVAKKVLVDFLDKMSVNYYFETDRNKGRNEKAKAKRDKLKTQAKRRAERNEQFGTTDSLLPPKKKRKKGGGSGFGTTDSLLPPKKNVKREVEVASVPPDRPRVTSERNEQFGTTENVKREVEVASVPPDSPSRGTSTVRCRKCGDYSDSPE
ncbi:hypothetical protein SARC_04392 [Sphaeroforma arctica JP610]|uniref:Uncharacterized protein n=1 Tax=Sphaeroforma arctica JP610 TaxID=667725 RepID=A0A0L0G3E1_9EUKA|nr:hypothetical protein SARC_04392 [Sphaeroforma arctica JP610]KNC83361.1 hypothetical protein SARC_04392 [Sphaeroforma arctica JP610]|eukprot:XP_014157263.1 hypothetical protein SARC_04392 [Sphaeroforma arctica JP610]